MKKDAKRKQGTKNQKLQINRQTLRQLTSNDLQTVNGGRLGQQEIIESPKTTIPPSSNCGG